MATAPPTPHPLSVMIPGAGASIVTPTLSSITWPTLHIAVPSDPHLSIPPLDATEIGGEPDFAAGITVPAPEFDSIDASGEPEHTNIVIPQPPELDLRDIMVAIPDLNVTIPDASVDWAYEAFVSAIMEATEIQAHNLDHLFDNLLAFWMREHGNLWGQGGFNLIREMGYEDVLEPYKNKELAHGRSIYQGQYNGLIEALRVRNLKTYISTMLAIEKQRRQQYAAKKEIELTWAKDIVTKSIEHYNLAIKAFASNIAAYKTHSIKFKALIDNNDLRLKVFEEQINAERLKIELDRNILQRYKTEIAVQVAMIDLYKSQMEVVRIISQIDAINIDMYKLGIEAFIYKVRAISEQARQQTLLADVDTMAARLEEIPLLLQELQVRFFSLQSELEMAQEKYSNEEEILTVKVSNLNALNSNIGDDAVAANQNMNAEINTIVARATIDRAEAQARADMADQERLQAPKDMENYRLMAIARAAAINARINATQAIQVQEILDNYLESLARKDAAKELQNSNLTNIFTEYESTPPPA